MKITLSVVAAALLGACATSPPDNTFAYRPGFGVVENVSSERVAVPRGAIAGSAAAGGSYQTPIERLARPRWIQGHQLTLRMDDGTTQKVTQDSNAFKPGERVQVLSDGRIARVSAPPAASALASPLAAAGLRPGPGVIEAVTPLSGASAAAGGTGAAAATVPMQQLTVRMQDGGAQVLTLHGGNVQVGERVRITEDGRLTRE